MSEKMQFKIYQLNLNNTEIDKKSIEKYIGEVVLKYNKDREESEKFKEQKLKSSKKGNYNLKLYYQTKKKNPEWLDFFVNHVEENEAVLKSENTYHSIVLFIYNNNSLYGVSKGQGNFLINSYVKDDFGIDILSRIIKPKENNIKSISDISVIGNVLSEEKYYRREHNILLEDSFGKVYKNLNAGLFKENLQYLALNDDIFKEVSCDGSSFFSLKASLSFEQLIKLVQSFYIIQKKNKSILPREMKRITNKEEKNILKTLLINKVIEAIKTNNFDDLFLEAIHSNFVDFFKAKTYKLKYNKEEIIENIKDISFLSKVSNFTEKHSLEEIIDKIKLIACDDEGNLTCYPKNIIDSLTGEIVLDEKPYFFLEGIWYKIENGFTESLNVKVKEVFNFAFNANIIKKWDIDKLKKEEDYNKEMGEEQNYISLDKKTKPFEYIELFDLIEIDKANERLRMFHVKKGFNQNMRNLTYQAEIAAKYIYEDNKQNRELAEKAYNLFSDKDKLKITKEEFCKFFYNSNLEIYIAIKTGDTQKLSVDTIEKFQSSIAKHSLIEVYKEITNRNLKFYFTEI